MIRTIRLLSATLLVVYALSAPVMVSAQGTKPAPKPAPPRQQAPGTAKPQPATPAPQARRIVRTDVVNETTVADYNDSRRVAVVAAVGKYDDPALAPLRFTVADAVELSAELKRQGYIVHTLLNSEATNDNIRERLESVSAGGGAPGTVLFAFAGHGFQSEKGVNYLATFSTTIETLEQRGLSLPDVQALMKATGAKRSVLLIDACRNVPGTRAVGTTTTFRDFDKSEGVRTLMSTRPGGFSYEDQALQHGIFTHYVIEGLRGKAANTDSKVTFEDLAGYVEKRVEAYAAEKSLSQKPFRSVDASGDFLLSVATPLKEEEIVKVRDESGGKDMPSNAVSVARTGVDLFDGYVMVAEDESLRLYRSPGMQLYANLQPDKETKNVPEGWKRYIGYTGAGGNDVVHAVVRFQGGLPAELRGRLGAKCEANCKGQDLKIYEGESLSAAGMAGKVKGAADIVKRLPFGGGRRTQDTADKTKSVAEGTQAALLLMDGRSWTKFDLAPRLNLRSR